VKPPAKPDSTKTNLPLSHSDWKKRPKQTLHWNIDVLCDRIQSPENAAHIIRTSEGLGVQNVFFLQPAFTWNKNKLRKLSRSTTDSVSVKTILDISELEPFSYKHVLALEYTQQSRSIYQNNSEGNTLLILGSEYDGIQISLLNLATKTYHIPLVGKQSSINVAQAFSGALVFLNAQRMKSHPLCS